MTDHNALVEIENIPNPRLRAFREKLMDISINAVYLPGKKNEAAAALSHVAQVGRGGPNRKSFSSPPHSL